MSLRQTMYPNKDKSRRTENALQLWILEAKGLPSKRKYFCELCLDKTLYARTSSKPKTDLCFWGEFFEFSQLPKLDNVCVNLYREADRKKRKDRSNLIGFVNIPVKLLVGKQPVERWYTVTGCERNSLKGDLPSIRIKARFQSLNILPLKYYKECLKLFESDYLSLCLKLEPFLSAKCKEDLATCLVHILHHQRKAKMFLADLIMAEVGKLENDHLMFRGNSLASKAMEAYMKLVGGQYLQDTLGDFVRSLIEADDDCEVDMGKLRDVLQIERQRKTLMFYVEVAWGKVINSVHYFPNELRQVFAEIRHRLNKIGRTDLSENLISSNIFLRFLCPAVLSPNLFGLMTEYPNERASRSLTLVAKTIQTLANFTQFGGKEVYMEFMNAFVHREWTNMQQFLRQISTAPSKDISLLQFDGFVDLGKELCLLHSHLAETMSSVPQEKREQFGSLVRIVTSLSDTANNPNLMESTNGDDMSLGSANGDNRSIDSVNVGPGPAMSPMSDYDNNISSNSYNSNDNDNDNHPASTTSSVRSQESSSASSELSSASSDAPSMSESVPLHHRSLVNGSDGRSGSPLKHDRHNRGRSDGGGGVINLRPSSSSTAANSSVIKVTRSNAVNSEDRRRGASPQKSSSGSSSVVDSPPTSLHRHSFSPDERSRSRTPAKDLSTDDDYVLFSALDENVGLRATGLAVQRNRLHHRQAHQQLKKQPRLHHGTQDQGDSDSAVYDLDEKTGSSPQQSLQVAVNSSGCDNSSKHHRLLSGGSSEIHSRNNKSNERKKSKTTPNSTAFQNCTSTPRIPPHHRDMQIPPKVKRNLSESLSQNCHSIDGSSAVRVTEFPATSSNVYSSRNLFSTPPTRPISPMAEEAPLANDDELDEIIPAPIQDLSTQDSGDANRDVARFAGRQDSLNQNADKLSSSSRHQLLSRSNVVDSDSGSYNCGEGIVTHNILNNMQRPNIIEKNSADVGVGNKQISSLHAGPTSCHGNENMKGSQMSIASSSGYYSMPLSSGIGSSSSSSPVENGEGSSESSSGSDSHNSQSGVTVAPDCEVRLCEDVLVQQPCVNSPRQSATVELNVSVAGHQYRNSNNCQDRLGATTPEDSVKAPAPSPGSYNLDQRPSSSNSPFRGSPAGTPSPGPQSPTSATAPLSFANPLYSLQVTPLIRSKSTSSNSSHAHLASPGSLSGIVLDDTTPRAADCVCRDCGQLRYDGSRQDSIYFGISSNSKTLNNGIQSPKNVRNRSLYGNYHSRNSSDVSSNSASTNHSHSSEASSVRTIGSIKPNAPLSAITSAIKQSANYANVGVHNSQSSGSIDSSSVDHDCCSNNRLRHYKPISQQCRLQHSQSQRFVGAAPESPCRCGGDGELLAVDRNTAPSITLSRSMSSSTGAPLPSADNQSPSNFHSSPVSPPCSLRLNGQTLDSHHDSTIYYTPSERLPSEESLRLASPVTKRCHSNGHDNSAMNYGCSQMVGSRTVANGSCIPAGGSRLAPAPRTNPRFHCGSIQRNGIILGIEMGGTGVGSALLDAGVLKEGEEGSDLTGSESTGQPAVDRSIRRTCTDGAIALSINGYNQRCHQQTHPRSSTNQPAYARDDMHIEEGVGRGWERATLQPDSANLIGSENGGIKYTSELDAMKAQLAETEAKLKEAQLREERWRQKYEEAKPHYSDKLKPMVEQLRAAEASLQNESANTHHQSPKLSYAPSRKPSMPSVVSPASRNVLSVSGASTTHRDYHLCSSVQSPAVHHGCVDGIHDYDTPPDAGYIIEQNHTLNNNHVSINNCNYNKSNAELANRRDYDMPPESADSSMESQFSANDSFEGSFPDLKSSKSPTAHSVSFGCDGNDIIFVDDVSPCSMIGRKAKQGGVIENMEGLSRNFISANHMKEINFLALKSTDI